MEDALDNMSGDLSGAFEEMISRIKGLSSSRSKLGMDVLMWLCHARQIMSAAELGDALAFRKSQGSKLSNYRPSLDMMLECCQGLVVRSADTRYIELAHYSIQEYLERNTPSLFPFAEHEMASICLGYLMLDDLKTGPVEIHDDCGWFDSNLVHYDLLERRLNDYPFASYASRCWDKHIRAIQATESVWHALLDFLHGKAIASAIQIRHFNNGRKGMYVDHRECLSRTSMHSASPYGLEMPLATMLEYWDPSTRNTQTAVVRSTPIILAAAAGHIRLVELLLRHGADPYIANWYGNALHCNVEANQPEIIVELVRSGMSPNDCEEYTKRGSKKSPVSCALDRDSVSALKTLISLGASVEVVDGSGQEPFLHEAATDGASKIVEYLLRNKLADVNRKSRSGSTALDRAIASGCTETVLTLLNNGAGSEQELAVIEKVSWVQIPTKTDSPR